MQGCVPSALAYEAAVHASITGTNAFLDREDPSSTAHVPHPRKSSHFLENQKRSQW